ncbi:MAG: cytochrome c biogenesis CcdA family protein [Desulfobaccales bacterium]
MVEGLAEILKSSSLSPAVLPAALILGLMGAATSCCSLPVLGAIAGYSGALGPDRNRRDLLLAGLCFMLGTAGAFAVLGAVSGWVGRVAGASLGFYWKLGAGFIMVLFGLASLRLLPISLARLGFKGSSWQKQSSGATIYGLALGGGAAACSSVCNPVLPAALAVTTLQGHAFWGAAILTVFSIGYSLPMTGVLVGLGFGFARLTAVVRKITPAINTIAGVLLIVIGFYLLANP